MPFVTEAYVARGSDPTQLFSLEKITLASLQPHEVLIATIAVAICHTDLIAASGAFFLTPPLVCGHEASGYVREIGAGVTHVAPGDAVVLSYASCGKCTMCISGKSAYCAQNFALNFGGKRADGSGTITDADGRSVSGLFFGQSSMARLVLAHESSVVKVEATEEELRSFAPLGCGIQTGSGAIWNIAKPAPGDAVVVFGGGAVGLAALHAAALTSPSQLILVDNSAAKLSMDCTNVATCKINSAGLEAEEVAEQIRQATNGRGAQIAIDTVGVASVLKAAHASLSALGMLITIAGGPTKPDFTISDHLTKGITYRGTHQGDSVSRVAIPYMISLWRRGQFQFDKMLSYYDFEDIDRALRDLRDGKVVKAVLVL